MLVWKGHKAKVRSLAFSPDGRHIATTAGDSKFAWLWDATTGRLARKLSSSPLAMRFVAFFPDGQHLVGLHEYDHAEVWHVSTGVRVAILESPDWLYSESLAIPPDGSRLVLLTGYHRLAEWDDPTRPNPGARRHDRHLSPSGGFHFPFQMGYSPGGRYFWVANRDVKLFDSTTHAERRTIVDPDGAGAMAVAFMSDESRICVAFGHRAAVWSLEDKEAPPVKLRGHKQQVRAVGFLPGGGMVLTAAMDGTVRLWDANSGAEQRSFDWGIGKVRVAAISPDGTMCAAGSDDGQLVVWDVDV